MLIIAKPHPSTIDKPVHDWIDLYTPDCDIPWAGVGANFFYDTTAGGGFTIFKRLYHNGEEVRLVLVDADCE